MHDRRFHFLLALPAGFFLLWLVLTGILLNHSHDLALDQRPLPNALLFLLDTEPPTQTRHWPQTQDQALNLIENELFWHARKLGTFHSPEVYATDYGWLIFDTHTLLVLDMDGLEIARLAPPVSSPKLVSISPIRFNDDTQCLELSPSFSEWMKCTNIQVQQQQPNPPASGATSIALNQWKLQYHLSWEQLILKLHNFSALGSYGKWVLDAAAVFLIAMLFTGLMIRRRMYMHQSARKPSTKHS